MSVLEMHALYWRGIANRLGEELENYSVSADEAASMQREITENLLAARTLEALIEVRSERERAKPIFIGNPGVSHQQAGWPSNVVRGPWPAA